MVLRSEARPAACVDAVESETAVAVGINRWASRDYRPRVDLGVNPDTGIDYAVGWEDTGPYVPIPHRYGSVKTAGLEDEATPGDQTFDIPLRGK
jgi:hypothetical protein